MTIPAPSLSRFWTGHLFGTNRGVVHVKLRQDGDRLRAAAIFHDMQVGTTLLTLDGTITARRGDIRIVEARVAAPVMPLDGRLVLEFAEDGTSAVGSWQSDVGTEGRCDLHPVRISAARWWFRRARAGMGVRTLRALPVLYPVMLVFVAGLSLVGLLNLSLPAVVLLLVVAPLVMRTELKSLLDTFNVTKVGPVEFAAQKPLPVDLRTLVQHVEQGLAFVALDGRLAMRTKLMLQLIAWGGSLGVVDEFRTVAEAIGVDSDNVDDTRDALVAAGCITASEGKFVLSDFGRAYLAHLTATPIQRA